ncbi:DNA translocase FtsK [Bacillaceae bacterium S4-13-58]
MKWNDIKQWVQKWKHQEEEVEEKIFYSSSNITPKEQDIQTKIVYQYPRRSDFFQSVERVQETNLKPSFSKKTNSQSQKVTRFIRSDVPSPVYGFKKEGDKEIRSVSLERKVEQKPAFERRKEGNSSGPFIDKVSIEKEEDTKVIQEVDNKNKEEKVQASSIEKEENPRMERNVVESGPPKRRLPFNVLMTPGDKRIRVQREKEMEVGTSKVENKTLAPLVPFDFLSSPSKETTNDGEWIKEQEELLTQTLHHFHIKAKVVGVMRGPAVTRFEVQPAPGVKVSKITNLSDDIKLNLSAKDIRIEAPIPGKNTIGIEVPNLKPVAVVLKEILDSKAFQESMSPLMVGLGLDIGGQPILTDLKKMPHGLIAGATGSGKSVCINTILISLLYKASPKEVKLLLIDPKMVELAPYRNLPHLVTPVITDSKAATNALKWAVEEMEQRYEQFVKAGVRDIDRYNSKANGDKMPYIVIIIDELADLMMVSPQDVEDSICRIAQKARACGIHLLIATQRPSVDVITGLIKANIPTRIAFSVSSQVDSRTILDASGAERLLGKGDMLFLENGTGKPKRLQGAFVSDDEIDNITDFIRQEFPTEYWFEQEELVKKMDNEEAVDELFVEAAEFVIDQSSASASLLQRRFRIGYNRAARLLDQLEENGIVSEANGSKPREVLVSSYLTES